MLTIGRIARLFGITAKTLRHYEGLGLFVPARVDAWSAYRYYTPEQLPQLANILRLRSIGMPLEAIRELGDMKSAGFAERLTAALTEHSERLKRQLEEDRSALAATEDLMLNLTQRNFAMMKTRVVELPAFRLIGLELEDGKIESIGPMWDRFCSRCAEIVGNEAGVAYGACIGEPGGKFRYLAGVRVAEDAPVPDGMTSWVVPAQKYAIFVHRGPYKDMGNTVRDVYAKGLPENGLTTVEGIDLERYEFARCPMPDGPETEVDLYAPVA
ncbi:MerR family transcriptional regulator [Niveibacterium terrae]|uniref:MerR family transcriptional regulator n=1 Tax=Niveibacterium terrae TaxID=3373598 RepID=UPI003A93DB08